MRQLPGVVGFSSGRHPGQRLARHTVRSSPRQCRREQPTTLAGGWGLRSPGSAAYTCAPADAGWAVRPRSSVRSGDAGPAGAAVQPTREARRQGAERGVRPIRRRAEDLRRRHAGRARLQSRRGARRVPDPARPVRLGQDHLPDDARGLRGGDPWRDHPRWPADQQRPAVPARHRRRVPELRAVPAHDDKREPGVPARGAQSRGGRDRSAGQEGARHGPARGFRAAPAGPALGRPAAAGRGGARSCSNPSWS
jgi:hypothetical protein